MTPENIAMQFDFPLDRTWSKLTPEQQSNVERAMKVVGGVSVNGVSGWFFNLYATQQKHLSRLRG